MSHPSVLHIPKKIHFFWGAKHTPPIMQFCIESWKRHLPDYELIEWTAESVPKNACRYFSEAVDAKKWAFVSDYVRLHALLHQGGIYLDTDVEITESLDRFLSHRAFIGFEDDKLLNATLIGAEPNHPWIARLLSHYNDKAFRLGPDRYDLTPNPRPITQITRELFGLEIANSRQSLQQGLEIYPREYFSPKDWQSGKINRTGNTHAIHHFNASWWDATTKRRYERRKKLIALFGSFIGKSISVLIEKATQPFCRSSGK